MTRRRGAVVLGAALGALLTVPAAAQDPAVDVRLVVTAIDAAVSDGDDLAIRALVENRGVGEATDLTLLVEVFAPVRSRDELHAALDHARTPTRLLEATSVPVADGGALPAGDVAPLAVTVEDGQVAWPDDGVHPVRLTVARGRQALDEVTTAVVRLVGLSRPPLPTVVGWPLDDAPWRVGPDAHLPDSGTAIQPGGRLERLLWGLEQAPDAPVALLVGAHLVDDVSDRVDGFRITGRADGAGGRTVGADDQLATVAQRFLTRLQTAAARPGRSVVVGPYADADLASLVHDGAASEAVQSVSEARRRVEAVLERGPAPGGLWASVRLDPATQEQVLVPTRTRTLVIAHDQLLPADDEPTTHPPVQVLPGGGVEVTALVGDPWLGRTLARLPDRHGAPVAVQRVLAETAAVHLTTPTDEQRGLVLLPPPAWQPPTGVAGDLLSALARAPWLELTDSDGLLRAAPDRPSATGLAPLGQPSLPEGLSSAVVTARTQIAALQRSLTAVHGRVGTRTWAQLDEALLRAPSTWWARTSPGRGADLVAAVIGEVAAAFGEVRVPDDTRVTLTDETGTVPVTVTRVSGAPLRVLVTLEASPRLEFTEGASRELVLEPGTSRTIPFPVVARGSGRIPVTVRVSAGAGEPLLAQETLVVHSTAISTAALAVLGGVLGVLFAWWLFRRLRPRRPPLRVVRDEAA